MIIGAIVVVVYSWLNPADHCKLAADLQEDVVVNQKTVELERRKAEVDDQIHELRMSPEQYARYIKEEVQKRNREEARAIDSGQGLDALIRDASKEQAACEAQQLKKGR